MCICMCLGAGLYSGVWCPQRLEASDLAWLEFQAIVSCPTWVLGTSGLLKEQQVLLTTESALQPTKRF